MGIEFNLFGAHLSSGSALFDWIDDYEELHGKEKEFVRFVDDWKAPVIESQDPQPDPAGGGEESAAEPKTGMVQAQLQSIGDEDEEDLPLEAKRELLEWLAMQHRQNTI